MLVADDFVSVPQAVRDGRMINALIGKGTPARGTRPDLEVGNKNVLLLLVLQCPASQLLQGHGLSWCSLLLWFPPGNTEGPRLGKTPLSFGIRKKKLWESSSLPSN